MTELKVTLESEERSIFLYWFKAWEEFKPPEGEGKIALLSILQMLSDKVCDDSSNEKALVHCRAGQGRSGTFLTLMTLIY